MALAQGVPVYRWVSPSGVVSYGDQPPRDAHAVKRLAMLPTPPQQAKTFPDHPPPAPAQMPAPHTVNPALQRLQVLSILNTYLASEDLAQQAAARGRRRYRYPDSSWRYAWPPAPPPITSPRPRPTQGRAPWATSRVLLPPPMPAQAYQNGLPPQ